MRLNITQLPADILIAICVHANPEDLLAFIQASSTIQTTLSGIPFLTSRLSKPQTCHAIHDVGSMDYVWHNIDTDLLLDIDQPLSNLSSSDIKRAVIHALKLDENWNKTISRVSRISQLVTCKEIRDLRPLGRNWLVFSYHTPDTRWGEVYLSILHLHSASGAQTIERSLALISVGGGSMPASIANFLNGLRSVWTVYQLALNYNTSSADSDNSFKEPHLLKEYVIEHSGAFCDGLSCTTGPIAAAISLVRMATYQILLLNTDTNVILQVEFAEPVNLTRLQICLPYIIFLGIGGKMIKVYVRELPKILLSNETVKMESYTLKDVDIPSATWESSVVDYESDMQPGDSVRLARSENMDHFSELNSITVLACRCSWNGTTNEEQMAVFHFPVDTSRRNLHITGWQAMYTFSIPSLNGTWSNLVGRTGRRTVCMSKERSDNTTVEVTMKASLPTNSTTVPLVHNLLVAEMGLPFGVHRCKSVYLEEASGRLFVTLDAGEVYLLEFGSV